MEVELHTKMYYVLQVVALFTDQQQRCLQNKEHMYVYSTIQV